MSQFAVPQSLKASGTINIASFVKIDTANDLQVLQCGAGDIALGVCQWAANAFPDDSSSATPVAATTGQDVVVYSVPGSQVPLMAGTGGWTPGKFLKPDASGNGVVCATGDKASAYALSTCAAGDIRDVLILPPGIVSP